MAFPRRLVEIAQVAYEEAEEVLLQANGEMYEAIDRLLGSKGKDVREVSNFLALPPLALRSLFCCITLIDSGRVQAPVCHCYLSPYSVFPFVFFGHVNLLYVHPYPIHQARMGQQVKPSK